MRFLSGVPVRPDIGDCPLEPRMALDLQRLPFSECQLDILGTVLDGTPEVGPSRRPRSSQVNSANPDHEKHRGADFVVDTSRGFDAARAELRAILDAVATMPKRRR